MTDREALANVIIAWETLPTGHHSAKMVGAWLRDTMAPAINEARKALGLEPDQTMVGVAPGRGPHGQPGHRCSGFCPEYGK